MASNDELKERIALLEKEAELLKQILFFEEQIQRLKHEPTRTPPKAPWPTTPWWPPTIYS